LQTLSVSQNVETNIFYNVSSWRK